MRWIVSEEAIILSDSWFCVDMPCPARYPVASRSVPSCPWCHLADHQYVRLTCGPDVLMSWRHVPPETTPLSDDPLRMRIVVTRTPDAGVSTSHFRCVPRERSTTCKRTGLKKREWALRRPCYLITPLRFPQPKNLLPTTLRPWRLTPEGPLPPRCNVTERGTTWRSVGATNEFNKRVAGSMKGEKSANTKKVTFLSSFWGNALCRGYALSSVGI